MKKVFCENCKYSLFKIFNNCWDIGRKGIWVCKQVYMKNSSPVYKDASYCKCEDVNENNNCPLYKRCLFPKLKKIVEM